MSYSYKEVGQCKDKYKIEGQVAVPSVFAGGRGVGCGMVGNLTRELSILL
jgi:hypothetical protein